MPRQPARYCRHPDCPHVLDNGEPCPNGHTRRVDHRPSAAERGYDHNWQATRARFLATHPWCAHCGNPATVADHTIPRRVLQAAGTPDPDHPAHLQPLCKACHDHKTAHTDTPGWGTGRWQQLIHNHQQRSNVEPATDPDTTPR